MNFTRKRLFPVTGRRRPLVALLLAGICALGSETAGAGQRERRSPEQPFPNPDAWPSLAELVERADTIVAGEVTDVQSAWTADRREIVTTVTLRPNRRFKGGDGSLTRFRIPGGTVGDTRLTVTHSPAFAIGDQALVFLTTGNGPLPRVVGGEAGRRRIRMGADGEATIRPGFALSATGSAGLAEVGTLDELAGAMPGLLAATQSR